MKSITLKRFNKDMAKYSNSLTNQINYCSMVVSQNDILLLLVPVTDEQTKVLAAADAFLMANSACYANNKNDMKKWHETNRPADGE